MRSVKFTADNIVTLLHCGAEFFPALAAAIDAAEVEVYFETYIFADDETGTRIAAALQRAAARGVFVNVIVDWLGTGEAQSLRLKQEFARTGVNFRRYNPWFRRGMSRMHRKLCVVDRQIGFVSGLNINDDMRDDEDSRVILPAPRWDFGVSIIGPLVTEIQQEMEAQWVSMGRLQLNLRARLERLKAYRHPPPDVTVAPAMAALVVRDNLRNRRTIERAYLQALGRARNEVWLANPYFAPGRKMRVALAAAAARGVSVTLLLGVGQFRLQDAVARSYYPKLLKSGVRILEYRKTQLHGKVAVVDDQWATVGSSNYDGLSLFINQEANVVVRDVAFATALRQQIASGVADSVAVRQEDFAKIHWCKRIGYRIAYFFYRNTIRFITWANES
ncbi:cardiolipin synthase ClsB [Noviherbaspirillum sedimenti]|uniref:Cardiolipin synthase B n=1 Tax=Noviherbaspirillum sedimenti TaxID=2320865 RepID=A0A3A3GMV4_9BURK|nr:cardiolipin synthase ClsB [Noviherbaspirillum sedimenti]RJG03616.1 cardiolipin synthase ClsB [Noviherbaspirillum sedimenti]